MLAEITGNSRKIYDMTLVLYGMMSMDKSITIKNVTEIS